VVLWCGAFPEQVEVTPYAMKMVHNLNVTSQGDFDVELCVVEIQLVEMSVA